VLLYSSFEQNVSWDEICWLYQRDEIKCLVGFVGFVLECRLVMPGSVLNGVAISKTFQILYRKEDIDINDVIAFKVYMLVDMLKVGNQCDLVK